MNSNHLLVLALAFLISACTSLVEKGDKLFQSGNYQAAAEFYEQALARDRNNVEAKIGLAKARDKIVDRGLIEVRMLRLSSNMAGAADKLEQILRNQQVWSLQLTGAIASTQAEETRYAKRWLLQEGKRLANTEFPDQYRQFEQRFSHLISSAQLATQLEPMTNTAREKGLKNCRSFASNVYGQRFFLKAFTEKYCAAWQQPVHLNVSARDETRFNGVQVSNSVRHSSNYGSGQRIRINNRLRNINEIFRKSIWYANIGERTLGVRTTGRTQYLRHAEERQRFANYTTQSSTKVKNAVGEEVTKTREIKRTHPYFVWVYNEEFYLDINLHTQISDRPLTRNAHLHQYHSTESHEEDFPEADLYPQAPSFLDLTSVVDMELTKLESNFLHALDQQWRDHWCGNQLGSEFGEYVLRCASIDSGHTFVNTWFTGKFGVNYTELSAMYGL